MRTNVPFILASASPRRRRLLEQLGFTFRVQASPVDETMAPGVPPERIVEELAGRKAASIADLEPNALTLGADTIVVLDGKLLGKPSSPSEAAEMLRQLSGRTHVVFTGFALIHRHSNRYVAAHETTRVTFGIMSPDEIHAYVRTGSPLDKAGAYGIQDDRGALFVSRVEGDYYNVVGLPLHRLYRVLKTHFSDLLENGGYL